MNDKQPKQNRKGAPHKPRVSLYPLTFDQA
jgi:hypothetical protein